MDKTLENRTGSDANRDPLSGAPGAHPVGVGVGAIAGGAATGAAVGTVAGPIGTGIGAAVGAIVGGLVGKGIAEGVNPTVEDAYWRDNYATRPYYEAGRPYEEYRAAYQTGWEARVEHRDRRFEDIEPDLRTRYEAARQPGSVEWNTGRHAVRDAWDQIADHPDL